MNTVRQIVTATASAKASHAAFYLGRLDQALKTTRITPALLFRHRLDAIEQHAAVDGHLIDPWYLVAELHGLTPKVRGIDGFERGTAIDAAHHAFALWQWFTRPKEDQRDAIEAAERALRDQSSGWGPVLDAGIAFHHWLQAGHARAPFCAALSRYWQSQGLLRMPLFLTGIKALSPETPWQIDRWLSCWLDALTGEIRITHALLDQVARAHTHALEACGAQRRHSRAPQAITIMTVQPLVSASMLADRLTMTVQNAQCLLNRFVKRGIAIEVTHRAAYRLFGLAGLSPLRAIVVPPHRPVPGRKRGRPRKDDPATACVANTEEEDHLYLQSEPLRKASLGPIMFDYDELADAMAKADEAMMRSARLIASMAGKQS
jgi:hypothetical protein